MASLEQQSQDKYGQLARKLFKIATLSGSKMVRNADQPSTEILQEFGTTDVAIGDATADVMVTTQGKIPKEMYYLEDTIAVVRSTTCKVKLAGAKYHAAMDSVSESRETHNTESESHSPILFGLLTALLIILLLCCTTACLIAKTKRRSTFFGKEEMECDPGCTGINQPLLNKISDCTSKTSMSSMNK